MERYFFKPVLANPSLGARITYLMKLKGYSDENMAEYFGWGGDDPVETMRKYKNNNRVPGKERLKEMAELFGVNINAIKPYDFKNPIEQIYYHMWEEELCPYSEYIFDKDAMKKTYYNEDIIRGLEEWGEMREKRMKGEISDQEYIEWKLNYNLYS